MDLGSEDLVFQLPSYSKWDFRRVMYVFEPLFPYLKLEDNNT